MRTLAVITVYYKWRCLLQVPIGTFGGGAALVVRGGALPHPVVSCLRNGYHEVLPKADQELPLLSVEQVSCRGNNPVERPVACRHWTGGDGNVAVGKPRREEHL